MKKGQVSMEFITIFGFVMLMTIPLIYVFYEHSQTVEEDIAMNQLRNLAIKITDTAENIYYLGAPSKTVIRAHFPEHIQSVNITHNTIVFMYEDLQGDPNPIQWTAGVNITGSLSPTSGVHIITLEATADEVVISE